MPQQHIRTPAVAGQFYPEDATELTQLIKAQLASAEDHEVSGSRILGGIVPHAGIRFSGEVAAHTYRSIQSIKPETVILIGPSHREYFPYISVYSGDGFKTPLGTVPIDRDLRDKITSEGGIKSAKGGHGEEHALEVQIPFLQTIYTHDYSILPVTMGDQSRENVELLAAVIGKYRTDKMLVVSSSDLSHFYSARKAELMDNRFAELVESLEVDDLWNALDQHEIEACGFGPVLTLLTFARERGATKCEILRYAHSGDVTGDTRRVVGYLAAIIREEIE
ncbi:MAG: AmmeMemoRadiSam system protein B [Candidatus Marinimicrobia bacterium]|nr:AmmeMemoRadiSam system protein B [Candidatus Neomarinimicrobiota bacterium]MCF7880213.1 AmmeMemoRadiSam system protein B [Candidatus Neomarinimicrobiota bacterium]